MVVIFLFWILFAVLVGVYASGKGRSGAGFFVLALLLSPLVAFIIALIVKPSREEQEARAIENHDMRKCPRCAELVKAEAKMCRYCRSELPPPEGIFEPPTKQRVITTDEEYCRAYNIKSSAK
jgi:hypothetical protein